MVFACVRQETMRQLSCSAAEFQKILEKNAKNPLKIQFSIQPRPPTPSSLPVGISFLHYTRPQPLMSTSLHLTASTLISLLI